MRWPLGPLSAPGSHDFKDSKLAMFQFCPRPRGRNCSCSTGDAESSGSAASEGSWLCMRPSQSSSHTQVRAPLLLLLESLVTFREGLCPRGAPGVTLTEGPSGTASWLSCSQYLGSRACCLHVSQDFAQEGKLALQRVEDTLAVSHTRE